MIHPPQEPDIVPGRRLLGIGAGVVLATIVGVLVAWVLQSCRLRELGFETAGEARLERHGEWAGIEQKLFAEEAQGLDDHRRSKQVLASYGWVDRGKQLVRIPVERAYALVIARRGAAPAAKEPEKQPERPRQEARRGGPGGQR